MKSHHSGFQAITKEDIFFLQLFLMMNRAKFFLRFEQVNENIIRLSPYVVIGL